jgi:hypothetical protein
MRNVGTNFLRGVVGKPVGVRVPLSEYQYFQQYIFIDMIST